MYHKGLSLPFQNKMRKFSDQTSEFRSSTTSKETYCWPVFCKSHQTLHRFVIPKDRNVQCMTINEVLTSMSSLIFEGTSLYFSDFHKALTGWTLSASFSFDFLCICLIRRTFSRKWSFENPELLQDSIFFLVLYKLRSIK